MNEKVSKMGILFNANHLKQIPNLITGLRLLLVPFMVWLLLEDRYLPALGVFTLMGISDAMDGFLAKRYGWKTRLGEFLDPVADKTMLVSAFVALGWSGLVPAWLVILVIARDVVILGGAAAYHLLTRQLYMAPTIISKLNTFAQIVLVLAVILDQLMGKQTPIVQIFIGLTLITTVASGFGYVIEWSGRARKELQKDGENM
jgi:cardiolipin synthase